MRPAQPTIVNPIEWPRPLCSKCGAVTQLARIMPANDPHYDLRTFECTTCDNADVVKIRSNRPALN